MISGNVNQCLRIFKDKRGEREGEGDEKGERWLLKIDINYVFRSAHAGCTCIPILSDRR